MSRNLRSALVRGERVYLRHPRKADMDEFTRLVIASRRFLHPWVTPASTPEAYARYLQYSRRASVCAFLICRSEDLQDNRGLQSVSNIPRQSAESLFGVLGWCGILQVKGT